MKRIEGRAKTIRELMDRSKFAIDFYQREYAWQERQVRELIDDLSNKFLDHYKPGHARQEVRSYGHYFLGSVVVSHKRDRRFIVDGQQRLTTLTLLFIYLHHLQQGRPSQVDVRGLVFSEEYGTRSFNLDVPERAAVMSALLHDESLHVDGQPESVRNIAAQYATIRAHFPDDIGGQPQSGVTDSLPYFVDWLLNNVHVVEIEAYSDDDAYSIFETMNDRGLSLSLPEMLKGYLLANIRDEAVQREVNSLWKKHTQALKDLGKDEDVDFFKNWLRARYANTFQTKGGGERSKDYERIGSEFHRWVRDQRDAIGLTDSESFARWVLRDFDFYARQTLRIREASTKLTQGLESIRYNEERSFTQQLQLLLAPLQPDETPAVIDQKLRLVSDFVDIWLARRDWCFRSTAQRNTKNEIFALTKAIRGCSVTELSTVLRERLSAQEERFARRPDFGLHKQNYRQVRHILARLTNWVDESCGLHSHFDDLVSTGRGKPFEIEHIWANHWDRFTDEFEHPADFDHARNRIGGLLMLQQGLNQSLGDDTYEDKRTAYSVHSQNLLAQTLHPAAYENNPALRQLLKRTGLPFQAYNAFGPEAQQERQELYIRIAEWVWNPSRLSLGEVQPPVHEPIGGGVAESKPKPKRAKGEEPLRFGERKDFWTELLAHALTKTSYHSNCSPTTESWIAGGSGKSGLAFIYVLLQGATRVELYINRGQKSVNKALFDQLYAKREEVEAALGFALDWQRMDDKKSCRICRTLDLGGWAERERWPDAIPQTVDAMIACRSTLEPYIMALKTP